MTDPPSGLPGELLTDHELAEVALAADPVERLAADAVPFVAEGADGSPGLLPEWFMPAPRSSARSRRRSTVVTVVVVSLLALNAVGLCVTYGSVDIAW